MASPHKTRRKYWTIKRVKPSKVNSTASHSDAEIDGSASMHERRTRLWLRTLALLLALFSSRVSNAHEYWLAPVDTSWQTEQTFQADIRNGENFTGAAYPFDGNAFRVGGIVSENARRNLTGRLGDYPAIEFELQEPGVHLVLLETTARYLQYDTTADFSRFLNYHALHAAVSQQQAQSIAEGSVSEAYYRYIKTLFHVRKRDSSEQPSSFLSALESNPDAHALETQGQQFEIVIKAADAETDKLELLLLFAGEPLPERQIELFFSSSEGVPATRTTTETDAKGQAGFTVRQSGNYLLNSVWITPDERMDVDWRTYWASLTFNIHDNSQ